MSPRSAGLAVLVSALASALAAADLAEVKKRGTLRVIAVDLKESDEFFQLQGEPGFDREILESFARLQELKLQVVPVAGWDDLVPTLLANGGDVIAGRFTVTEERKRRIAFTHETFPTRTVVLTRKPTPAIQGLAELRNARVGTVRGSSMAEAVANAGVPPANVDDGIRPGGLPAALKERRVNAVLLGIENAITVQRADPLIELGTFVGPPGSLAFGVRPGDAALLQALDDYIDNLRRTATWNRLVVKYFGEQAPEVLKRARAE